MEVQKIESNRIFLTNVQRFSLHDGPGIRTTVFLKGCSLRCPWCSNPENLVPLPQCYVKDGIKGCYGKYFNAEELIQECLKDKAFYIGKLTNPTHWVISNSKDIDLLPGGVTFSGGEALLQIDALIPVIIGLHNSGVHIAVETCLFVPPKNLQAALEFVDLFYVDTKILDAERCNALEKGNLDCYLSNLDTLFEWRDKKGRNKPVVIRIPVIGSYTDTPDNRNAVKMLLKTYKNSILKIELIKEHNLGESKYKSLGMLPDYHGVEDGLMELYKAELETLGILTEICCI